MQLDWRPLAPPCARDDAQRQARPDALARASRAPRRRDVGGVRATPTLRTAGAKRPVRRFLKGLIIG